MSILSNMRINDLVENLSQDEMPLKTYIQTNFISGAVIEDINVDDINDIFKEDTRYAFKFVQFRKKLIQKFGIVNNGSSTNNTSINNNNSNSILCTQSINSNNNNNENDEDDDDQEDNDSNKDLSPDYKFPTDILDKSLIEKLKKLTKEIEASDIQKLINALYNDLVENYKMYKIKLFLIKSIYFFIYNFVYLKDLSIINITLNPKP